jgi:hypothetical protein
MTSFSMSKVRLDGTEQGHTPEAQPAHVVEERPGPSHPGSVVLDIGPGVGAAVILAPEEMNDLEIEYRVAGEEWNENHMSVRERQGVGVPRYAAIFAPLSHGVYEFRVRGSAATEPQLTVAVVEASVTSAAWPDLG